MTLPHNEPIQTVTSAAFFPISKDIYQVNIETLSAQFMPQKVLLNVKGNILELNFAGANSEIQLTVNDPLLAKMHIYSGNNPVNWQENIPMYATLTYNELYRGIDLRYTIEAGHLKSEFVVHPGATLEALQICYSGIESLHLVEDVLQIVVNREITLTEVIPYTYEELNGERRALTAQFVLLAPRTYGFRIQEARTPGATLVIDPELLYATYFGGTNSDSTSAITTDYEGNSYVTGNTWSSDLPLLNPSFLYQTNSQNIFIAKFDPQGALVYATYYGGNDRDRSNAIAVDMHGNAHVTGSTLSTNLPTLNAWQSNCGGTEDVYVVKIDASGKLQWATYIGRTGPEEADAIAVDQLGRVYIAGEVYADDYPLMNPWRSATYGIEDEDGFISILDPEGQLIYSTYVSASQRDQIFAIAVDHHGHVYAAGMTSSPDFPVHNAVQSYYGGGWEDCLILKLDPWNNELYFATFLGGLDREACWGIDFDQEGNIYVSGYTSSRNFPTVNAHQARLRGDFDAFIAKLSPSGTILRYATYLGGSSTDRSWGLVTDHLGYSYIVGQTESSNFPTRNALQPLFGGERDGFIAIFDPNGALYYASFLGGSNHDQLNSVALDGNWIVHVAGESRSGHLATADAYQRAYAGGDRDALMGRLAFIPTPTPTPTPTPYAAAEIGPEGGALWLSYPKHLTLLQVPHGVLSDATTFELVYEQRPDRQGDLQGLDHFFRLGINSPQNLADALPLTLAYQETRGVIKDTIMLYRLEGNRWVTNNITMEASSTLLLDRRVAWVREPGIYGLLGQTNRLYLPLMLRAR